MRICSIPMADRVVGPYIQRRKLLADSPQTSEKMLLSRGRTETSAPTTQIHNFSRADSTRKGYAASVRLLRRQRLRGGVRPYNVSRKIFCEKTKFLRALH